MSEDSTTLPTQRFSLLFYIPLGLVAGLSYALSAHQPDGLATHIFYWAVTALFPALALWYGYLPTTRLAAYGAGLALLAVGIGWHQYSPQHEHAAWSAIPAALVLWFILTQFVYTFHSSWPATKNYPTLFTHSWNNALVLLEGALFLGIGWALLTLSTYLFHLIGINTLENLVENKWFYLPYSTTLITLGIYLARTRDKFALALQRHWLNITAWFLPPMLVIAALFLLLGLGKLLTTAEGRIGLAGTLLGLCAALIKFINSAVQDHQPLPYTVWINRIVRSLVWVLLPLSLLAAYGLSVRALKYGLTPDRVWGLFVALLAVLYAIGYSWNSVRSFRMAERNSGTILIGSSNLVIAAVMTIGLLLLLSPALDPQRLSAESQYHHILQSGKFEWSAWQFKRDFGRYGEPLKQRLLALPDTPDYQKIRSEVAALDLENRGSLAAEKRPLQERIVLLGNSPAPPPALLERIAGPTQTQVIYGCEAQGVGQCGLLAIDLNRDGKPEWAVFASGQIILFQMKEEKWLRVAQTYSGDTIERLQQQAATTRPAEWDDLVIGEKVFRFAAPGQ